MRHSGTLVVGLDVHKETIAVAYGGEGQGAEVGSVANLLITVCYLQNIVILLFIHFNG